MAWPKAGQEGKPNIHDEHHGIYLPWNTHSDRMVSLFLSVEANFIKSWIKQWFQCVLDFFHLDTAPSCKNKQLPNWNALMVV